MQTPNPIRDAYAYHRARGMTATKAYAHACADMATNKTRHGPTASGWNPEFADRGSKRMRWIESPAACGLRFVGFADKLARVDHTGWHTDEDGSNGATLRGAVYQMPARNGRPLYVCGYGDPHNGSADNDGPACLSFADTFEGTRGECTYSGDTDCRTLRDAAHRADRIAELCAESEREYQAAWSAGSRYSELGDEAAKLRASARELIREAKAHARTASVPAAVCAAIKGSARGMLARLEKLRAERAALRAGEGHGREGWSSFWTGDARLCDAFAECAGVRPI